MLRKFKNDIKFLLFRGVFVFCFILTSKLISCLRDFKVYFWMRRLGTWLECCLSRGIKVS